METFRNPMTCCKELKITADALALTRRGEVLGALPLG